MLDLLTALVRHKQGKGRKPLDSAVKWIDTPTQYNAQPCDVRLRLRMPCDKAKALYT